MDIVRTNGEISGDDDINFHLLSDRTLSLLYSFAFMGESPSDKADYLKPTIHSSTNALVPLVDVEKAHKRSPVTSTEIDSLTQHISKIFLNENHQIKVKLGAKDGVIAIEMHQGTSDAPKTTFLFNPEVFLHSFFTMFNQTVPVQQSSQPIGKASVSQLITQHDNSALEPKIFSTEEICRFMNYIVRNQIGRIQHASSPLCETNRSQLVEMGSSAFEYFHDVSDDNQQVQLSSNIHDGIVEIELLQGSIRFTEDMWFNLANIMRNKFARVLQAAGDRIGEIDSVVSLFSDQWFRGSLPVSKYSLVWDFRNSVNTDDGSGAEELSIDDVHNDSSSTDNSADSDDDELLVKPTSEELENRLYALYHGNKA